MKKLYNKNIILVVAIIMFVVSFLKNWYADQLVNLFDFFYWLLSGLYKICYIVILVFAIKKFRTEKSFAIILTFIILFASLIVYLLFPFRNMKVNYELNEYEGKRMEILNKVINNEFVNIDENGNLKLPKNYRKYSTSGEITVYQNDNNGVVIGFWVYRGMLSGSTELIYSTGGEKLIRSNEKGHPIISVEELKEKWYLVKTDY